MDDYELLEKWLVGNLTVKQIAAEKNAAYHTIRDRIELAQREFLRACGKKLSQMILKMSDTPYHKVDRSKTLVEDNDPTEYGRIVL